MKQDSLTAVIGFAAGCGGFLLLFKLFILDRIPPADELAPGVVVAIAIASGTAAASLLLRWRHRGDGTRERH